VHGYRGGKGLGSLFRRAGVVGEVAMLAVAVVVVMMVVVVKFVVKLVVSLVVELVVKWVVVVDGVMVVALVVVVVMMVVVAFVLWVYWANSLVKLGRRATMVVGRKYSSRMLLSGCHS